MRVLLVDPIGTVNYKYSYSLANALKQRGLDVILVTDGMRGREGLKCPRLRLFNTKEKKLGKFCKLVNYIYSWRRILLLSERADIVHGQWVICSPVDQFFYRRLKRKGKKVILTVHDILPFNRKFYDRRCCRRIYGAADSIILQNQANVKRFKHWFPESAGKTVVIPHGNFLNYGEIMPREEARRHLGLAGDSFVFLFFGQIKKVKGLGGLILAFAKIREAFPEAVLVIAGSPWKDNFCRYEKQIKAYGICEAVKRDIRYIPDEEVKYYYSACDINVLPYLDVYQSGVMQLAFAYERPVLVTDLPAFTSVIADGKNGLICRTGSVSSLAVTMKRAILSSREELDRMGRRGRQDMERFSWDKIARMVEEEYRTGPKRRREQVW